MTPGFMVIGKIGRQESREVVFAEYDDVIEAFATQGPNHAFTKRILPSAYSGEVGHAFRAMPSGYSVSSPAVIPFHAEQ